MKLRPKRKLIIIGRAFSGGVQNIIRNIWLTVAATVVMMITLAIVLISGIANLALSETIDERTTDFTLGIFFNDNSDEALVDSFKKEIEKKEYVSEVVFVSKEEALRRFVAQYEDEEFISQGLALTGDNVLPASFDVRFNDLDFIDEIIVLTESATYGELVYSTSDTKIRRQSIQQYLSIQESVNRATLLAASLFGTVSVLIVFNTIRMAVFSRSREIEIMRLIGATRSYIRGPFLVEAMLYGFIAAVLAYSTVFSATISLLPGVSSIKSTDTLKLMTDYWYLILGGTAIVGMLVGLVSSWLATSRYLRLKNW